MTEQWLPVIDFESAYEVSNMGRVRSIDRTIEQRDGTTRFFPGRILAQSNLNGYRTVGLSIQKNSTRRTVQRVVLEAFIGKRPSGMEACHYDGDRSNNELSNLRWDAPKSNAQDKFRHGTNVREARSHCFKGHELDDANTYVAPNGERSCKKCRQFANRDSYYRNLDSSREYARNYYRDNYAIPAEDHKMSITEINAAKTNCKHGHPLAMPNLMPAQWSRGHRACLACSRARAYVNRHTSLKSEFQQVADSYFREIQSSGSQELAA